MKIQMILLTIGFSLFASCEIEEDIIESLKVTKEITKTNQRLNESIKKSEELVNSFEKRTTTLDSLYSFKPDTVIKLD